VSKGLITKEGSPPGHKGKGKANKPEKISAADGEVLENILKTNRCESLSL